MSIFLDYMLGAMRKKDKSSNGITPHIGENGHWFIGDKDTGILAMVQIVGSYSDVTSLDSGNTKTFTDSIPFGIKAPSGKFYFIEKGVMTINTTSGTATIDFTPYLAYEGTATFSGTWRVYFAGGPKEVTSNFLDLSTAAVLLAGKTDNADFTALSGRVSSVETTLPGKADQSDVTALSGRVSSVETALPGKAPAADAVQPGCVAAFAGDASNIPAGYLLCNGSAVSRTDYAALFAAIGTTYGAGDGSTTFNLPDFRGKFLRGYLDGTSAALGTEQGDAARNITGLVGYIQTMHRDSSGDYNNSTSALYASDPPGGVVYYNVETNGSIAYHNINVNFDASRNTNFPTAAENRPANYAVNYIIKY